MNLHWPFLAGAVLVLGCLSAAAATLRAMTRIWMRHWVEAQLAPGSATGSGPAAYLAESHHLLAVATAAGAFVIALTGALIGARADDLDGALLIRAALVVLAFLIVGQSIPRAIARRWAPSLAMSLLPILRLAAWLLAPVMRVAGAPGGRPRARDRLNPRGAGAVRGAAARR